jgi:hypothetical protein
VAGARIAEDAGIAFRRFGRRVMLASRVQMEQEQATMTKRKGRGVRVKTLSRDEKAAIATTCEDFIAEGLKPRFLPEVRPTQFSYPIDIFGKWRGSKYSFLVRYRSGFPHNRGEEFDSLFTRLDHVEDCLDETRFDVMWRRHTGQWWRVYSAVTLAEALRLIDTEAVLQPVI